MPRKDVGEHLLLLSLTLEVALESEEWNEADQLMQARAALIEAEPRISKAVAAEVGRVEERILTSLRLRLSGVRSDMRKLSAALRIAGSYTRQTDSDSLSLAG